MIRNIEEHHLRCAKRRELDRASMVVAARLAVDCLVCEHFTATTPHDRSRATLTLLCKRDNVKVLLLLMMMMMLLLLLRRGLKRGYSEKQGRGCGLQ